MSQLVEQSQRLIREEIDMQITTAKAYPRSVDKFLKDAVALATTDQETAESCIYSLSRGKGRDQTWIKGESIRLAEILLSCWGNVHAATRIVNNDGREITVEGVVWDLEKNLKVCKQVKRSILKSSGEKYSNEMQAVTANAASSIALRNSSFTVIPRSLVKIVYDSAVKCAIGDQTKFSQRVKSLFERFKKLGIAEEKILAYFGKKSMSEITTDEAEEMIGIGTAIKEKNLSIDNAFVFETPTADPKASALNEMLDKNENQDFIDEMDGKA